MASTAATTTATTAEEEARLMYCPTEAARAEIDEYFPNRPRNHSLTLPFHTLFQSVFNPLEELRAKPAAAAGRAHRPNHKTPAQQKEDVLASYIRNWRSRVGNDIYPAIRLILPDRDRDRALYGLKEKAIAKILIRVLRITKDSGDGLRLLNWKLPGRFVSTKTDGDFAGRCSEAISKRPRLTEPGDITIAEVNNKLDLLAATTKEQDQARILEQFYFRMNAEEMMWLIRIILRQMKIGLSEKTVLRLWHPDAESLFNITSNLKKVCWDLHDPLRRLNATESSVMLLQCFQPQLASFQFHSFPKIISRMKMPDTDQTFWIEEKLDGERIQLHMTEDQSIPGGFRFAFWSRRAKDYSYLYGNGFQDENSALTRFIRGAFAPAVRNIILDGEMITWDTEQKAVVPFGTLKTAALAEQQNELNNNHRPLYRVFDCLYLNDKSLTQYTLTQRRKALSAAIKSVEDRLEIHPYTVGSTPADIEAELRKVVEDSSEGLVVKNPRSAYRLNERHDDWIKVKPEYMSSFGEELDCIIVGGYYGSGRRGGTLSSFLCGLRVDQTEIDLGADPHKTYSFFKVGGGFSASDYADVRNRTEGKWHKWDPKRPPMELVELGGGVARQLERPDVWIHPQDSVVISVKAASVNASESFRTGFTLRFPRFKSVRFDKTWREALTLQEFQELRDNAEREQAEHEFQIDTDRKNRRAVAAGQSKRRAVEIKGAESGAASPAAGVGGELDGAGRDRMDTLFAGLTFFVMSEAVRPRRRPKAELEQLIRAHGGRIVQTHEPASEDGGSSGGGVVICVADKEVVKASSLKRAGDRSIVRPGWLYDCVEQARRDCESGADSSDGQQRLLPLPFEPRHMFFGAEADLPVLAGAVDRFGDGYARDVRADELGELLSQIEVPAPDVAGGVATEVQSGVGVGGGVGSDLNSRLAEMLIGRDGEGEGAGGLDEELLSAFMFLEHSFYFDASTTAAGDDLLPSPSDLELERARRKAVFLNGTVVTSVSQAGRTTATHIIVGPDRSRVPELRSKAAGCAPVPRIVSHEWIEESWRENTLLDESRFTV